MNIGVIIPQIWYDFIGRLVPGTYIICYLMLIQYSQNKLTWVTSLSSSGFSVLVTFAVLIMAYLIGTMLGSIWLFLNDYVKVFNRKRLSDVMNDEENKLFKRKAINEKLFYPELIPLIYDYIQLQLPKMGARIAKLRGEQHLCGALFTSSFFLFLFTVIFVEQKMLSFIPICFMILPAVRT